MTNEQMAAQWNCNKCGELVYLVLKSRGEWITLEVETVDKGPRYSLHRKATGSVIAARENTIKGHKKHVCKDVAQTPRGGHTPQLF